MLIEQGLQQPAASVSTRLYGGRNLSSQRSHKLTLHVESISHHAKCDKAKHLCAHSSQIAKVLMWRWDLHTGCQPCNKHSHAQCQQVCKTKATATADLFMGLCPDGVRIQVIISRLHHICRASSRWRHWQLCFIIPGSGSITGPISAAVDG